MLNFPQILDLNCISDLEISSESLLEATDTSKASIVIEITLPDSTSIAKSLPMRADEIIRWNNIKLSASLGVIPEFVVSVYCCEDVCEERMLDLVVSTKGILLVGSQPPDIRQCGFTIKISRQYFIPFYNPFTGYPIYETFTRAKHLQKPSYGFITCQNIISLFDTKQMDCQEFLSLRALMPHYLSMRDVTLQSVKKLETTLKSIDNVKRQIARARQKITALKSTNRTLASRLTLSNHSHSQLEVAVSETESRIRSVEGYVEENSVDISKILQAKFFKVRMLLLDLICVFPINLTCLESGLPLQHTDRGGACMTICQTALHASETPGFPTIPLQNAPVPPRNSLEPTGLVHEFFAKPSPHPTTETNHNHAKSVQLRAHHVLLQNNPVTAGCALAYAASVMNLLSTLLDVPLRYPLERLDRQARFYVWDLITPKLSREERKFLLHSTRSSEFDFYRYAIFLFNMNLMVFRGYFGMSTGHEIATLNNLKSLIEERLLYTPPNKKTVFSQLFNCYREKEHCTQKQEILL